MTMLWYQHLDLCCAMIVLQIIHMFTTKIMLHCIKCSSIEDYLRWMRLMSTPPALWNHPIDGLKHYKHDHLSACISRPNNLKLLKLELRKVLTKARGSEIFYFPLWCCMGEFYLFIYCSMLCKWATSLATWVIGTQIQC